MAKNLIICDFDGTINRIDVGYNILKKLVPNSFGQIISDYNNKKITNRYIYKNILAPNLKNSGDLLDKIIPPLLSETKGFSKFAKYCENNGIKLVILSDGFDIYIKKFLEKYKLDIEFFSNQAIKTKKGYNLNLSFENKECGFCGNCKSSVVKALKKSVDNIMYVGDGDSDICAVSQINTLFGKKKLLKKIQNTIGISDKSIFYFYDFIKLKNFMDKKINYKSVIFDLDGTLVDGFSAIYDSFNYALRFLGFNALPYSKIKKVIGPSLSQGFSMLVPYDYVQSAVKIYRDYYKMIYLERNALLKGVRELLEELNNKKVLTGVITNKKGVFAKQLLSHLGIQQYFSFVLGADEGIKPKPNIDFIDYVVKKFHLPKKSIVYVGDSAIDAEFANNAGVDFLALGTGLGKEDDMYKFKPLGYYNDLKGVLNAFKHIF